MPQTVDEVQEKAELIKKITDKYNELGQESYFITKMMDQESKTGRNNRCHCGSMKKYKKCCLPLYEEKVVRLVELSNNMRGMALELKELYGEIKELKNGINK